MASVGEPPRYGFLSSSTKTTPCHNPLGIFLRRNGYVLQKGIEDFFTGASHVTAIFNDDDVIGGSVGYIKQAAEESQYMDMIHVYTPVYSYPTVISWSLLRTVMFPYFRGCDLFPPEPYP